MTTASRRAILVLGMHRSGTSATARVLNLLGVEVGDKLVAPAADNSLGFWEHADAVDLNEHLLHGLGRSWDDIRPMPEDWLQSEIARQSVQTARELIRANFSNTPLWLIKDPRLCRVVPIWLQALEAEHIEPSCLFVARQPFEVALSLGKRDGTPNEFACFLWLRYMLEAELNTRGCSRVMMTYDDLLLDWRGCMQRVLASLGVTYAGNKAAAAAVDGYLSRAERHHVNASGLVSAQRSKSLARTVETAYSICADLAKVLNSARKWAKLGAMQSPVEKLFSKFHPDRLEVLEAMYRVRMKAYEKECVYKGASAELIGETRRCSTALAVAEKLALERLTELDQVTARLREADQALAVAGDLDTERLKELRVLDQALAAAQRARDDVSKLALERLTELDQVTARLREADQALAVAGDLSTERLKELRMLDQALAATQRAHDDVSKLALERLTELDQVTARLREADQALAVAGDLDTERLKELRVLDQALAATQRAFDNVSTLAVEGMHENEQLRGHIFKLEAALQNAEQLAVTRLAEIERLTLGNESNDLAPPEG